MSSIPKYWELYSDISKRLASTAGEDIDRQDKEAYQRARLFRQHGYLRGLLRDYLLGSHYSWAQFYLHLANLTNNSSPFSSVVEKCTDSSWIADTATCFVNARACGLQRNQPGNFLTAIRVLPTIRAENIHLAPFFDCVYGNIYAVNSLKTIAPEIVDTSLEREGLSAYEQLRIFIDAVHCLKKTVGFDLEPHTGQFSWIVLTYPQCFRWIRLSPDRNTLLARMPLKAMLGDNIQKEFISHIKDIISQRLKLFGFSGPEPNGKSAQAIRDVHSKICDELIAQGFWTLPSHTWGGAGLPDFLGYNHEKNHPMFSYVSVKGEDHAKHAFGMLTPYQFYKGLPINRVPKLDERPVRNDEAISLFCGLFETLQRNFGFDFVRIDYVDHVFDSIQGDDPDFPISDRITPAVLQILLQKLRTSAPYLGAMAERMDADIHQYRRVGFDLVLGSDILGNFNPQTLEWVFKVSEKVADQNPEGKPRVSVQLAVDTHDSGHPLFWEKPISEIIGPAGMFQRLFISRFATAGRGRRPKYECLGNQDLSSGLYEANNQMVSLDWSHDTTFNHRYHNLEDLFVKLHPFLMTSELTQVSINEHLAWWFIDNKQDEPERMVCLIYLEQWFKDIKTQLESSVTYSDLINVIVPINNDSFFQSPQIFEFDFENNTERPLPSSFNRIVVPRLCQNDVHLYFIRETA